MIVKRVTFRRRKKKAYVLVEEESSARFCNQMFAIQSRIF
jgi:hypothetical protein